MPRIPESEELARLVQLYGKEMAAEKLRERREDQPFIDALTAKGIGVRRIAVALAKRKHPELLAGRPWY